MSIGDRAWVLGLVMVLASSSDFNFGFLEGWDGSSILNLKNCNLDLPWDIKQTLHFIAYLLFTRKVKSKTVSCQLSGVRMAHLELGYDNPTLRTPLVNLLLKGTDHWDSMQWRLTGAKSRTPVTIDMMRVIKRHLFESTLDLFIKITFL